ncbi:MAG: G8 domain-containing protein [Pseudomonadota bacterium]
MDGSHTNTSSSSPLGHDHLEGDHAEHAAALDLAQQDDATHVAVKSGDWFDPATWDTGTVPGDEAKVFIPQMHEVTYDGTSEARIFTIGVEGKLAFAPETDSKLIVDTMIVHPSGELEVGTAHDPVTGNIDIVFANNGAIDTTWDPQLLSRGLVSLGDVSIHGTEIDSHTKVTTDPVIGDTDITLAEVPHGWEVGDTIVIAGTDNPNHKDSRYFPEYRGHTSETRTITEIDGNTIHFAEPLEYDHVTPRDYFKTSVANYSRSISFRSEDGADSEVYERGHIMFMGSDNVDVRFAGFYDLGRTDKSERSAPATSFEGIAFDSNAQGRYSLHLHKLGTGDLDNPIWIEGNAVIGSPGWGIAQHSSHANLHNNATLDIWGASYVSEAGDEIGTWTDNISIGNVGTLEIERNHDNVAAGDIARTGNGFWMQSRMIETVDNIAVAARTGFVWIVQGSTEGHDPSVLNFPEATGLGEGDITNRQIAISLTLNNETFGSERGLTVTKGFPNQENDQRTIIEGFDAWNVRTGILAQYTAHYTFHDIELVAVDQSDPDAVPSWGIMFGNNVSDMVLVEPKLDGFEDAYVFTDFFSPSLNANPETDQQYVIVGGEEKNIFGELFPEEGSEDATLRIAPEDLNSDPFSVNAKVTDIVSDDYRVYFEGTRNDSLGEFDLVLGTDRYYLKINDIAAIAKSDGYFTRNGAPIVFVEYLYTDRVTGEIIKVAHEMGFEDPNMINRGHFIGSIYNGELPDDNPPPVAYDDEAATTSRTPVTVDLLANDSDETTYGLKVDGVVQPKHGKVKDNGDGSVTYTPDAGFTGEDSFAYWVTDGFGSYTKATTTVQVLASSGGHDEDMADVRKIYAETQSELDAAIGLLNDGGTVALRDGRGHLEIDAAQVVGPSNGAAIRTVEPASDDTSLLTIVMPGFDGHDSIFGAQHKDVLKGGGGLDRLWGGEDSDIFVYGAGTGLDIVYDFTDGEDRIYLDGIAMEDISVSAYRSNDTLLQAGADRMILRNFNHADFSEDDIAPTEDWLLS